MSSPSSPRGPQGLPWWLRWVAMVAGAGAFAWSTAAILRGGRPDQGLAAPPAYEPQARQPDGDPFVDGLAGPWSDEGGVAGPGEGWHEEWDGESDDDEPEGWELEEDEARAWPQRPPSGAMWARRLPDARSRPS